MDPATEAINAAVPPDSAHSRALAIDSRDLRYELAEHIRANDRLREELFVARAEIEELRRRNDAKAAALKRCEARKSRDRTEIAEAMRILADVEKRP